MEIVIVTGVVALAGLVLLSLRVRAARGVRKARSQRARGARPAAAAAGAGSAVAFSSLGGGGGGVAVQDPPRTREADLDDWDDDLGWGDDLEGPAPAPVASEEPSGEIAVHEPPAPAAESAPAAPGPVPPAAPYSLGAATPPARVADDEPDWDDDLLSGALARRALPDGAGRPIPSARGAAAFGASQATPPRPKPKRGAALRSPVVMVAVYAVAGIALVVLAVSLLSSGLSPSAP